MSRERAGSHAFAHNVTQHACTSESEVGAAQRYSMQPLVLHTAKAVLFLGVAESYPLYSWEGSQ